MCVHPCCTQGDNNAWRDGGSGGGKEGGTHEQPEGGRDVAKGGKVRKLAVGRRVIWREDGGKSDE